MDQQRLGKMSLALAGLIEHNNNAHCDDCLTDMSVMAMSCAKDLLSMLETADEKRGLHAVTKNHLAHIVNRLNAASDQKTLPAVVDASLRYMAHAVSQLQVI